MFAAQSFPQQKLQT